MVGKLTRHAEKCDYCRNFHYADERSCGEQRRETYIPCVVASHSDYVRTADKRKYYVHYVAYIVNDRHQHIGKGVCFIRSFAQFVVERFHFLHRFFFVTEHLDHFLTVHHFFDVTFHFAGGLLLRHKVFRALAAYFLGYEQYGNHAENYYQKQRNAHVHHGACKRYKHDYSRNGLRQTLRYKLTKRVDVVSVSTHYIAVRVAVEITDGQRLHFGKHFNAYVAHELLREFCAYLSHYERRNPAESVYAQQNEQGFYDSLHGCVCGKRSARKVFQSSIYLLQKRSGYRAGDRA